MKAIETKGLTKKYGEITAVNSLDLTVEENTLFALLGVNGAGKSTTVKLLTCLTRPDAGDAFLLGNSIVTQSEQVRRLIGVSPQETAIAPKLTVKENLAFIASLHGMKKREAEEKTAHLCEKLGLREVLARPAGKLSGGWQRRLSIAMALVSSPKVLFLDEPTLGLDVLARAELWELIRELKRETTVVLTTHYMEEAESLSDSVGIMAAGKLIMHGSAEEIKTRTGCDRFEDAFVCAVKGAM